MIIVTKDDFIGQFQLARSTANDPLLQSYIDDYEIGYIYDLLGVDLGKLFIANLDGTTHLPINPLYLTIYNPFAFQPTDFTIGSGNWEGCNCYRKIWQSKGIKFILVSLIYFNYVHKTQLRTSQSGGVLPNAEVSAVLNPRDNMRIGEQKWNAALNSTDAIQWYCGCFKKSDYPDFKGIRFKAQYRAMI